MSSPYARSVWRRSWSRLPPLSLRAHPEHQLVDVAPAPVLAGLGRADDRVARGRIVGGGVLPGELSQQPMWPQVWHIRRWTQLIPSARHSSRPATSSGGSSTRVEMCAGRSVPGHESRAGRPPRRRLAGGAPSRRGADHQQGLEDLRTELADLEGPRARRWPHGSRSHARKATSRRTPSTTSPKRTGAPGDPDPALPGAPPNAVVVETDGRPDALSSASPPRSWTRTRARSTPGPWSARPRPTSPPAGSRPSRRSAAP